jgi:hypothetical protein
MTILSFHNDPAIKKTVVDAMIADKKAERLIQGNYTQGDGDNFKGCFIGCITRTDSAEKTAQALGESVMLVKLRESIFEGLPFAAAQDFAVDCLTATPVGKDLSLVPWQFLNRMLRRAFARIAKDNPVHANCADALEIIAKKARGDFVSYQEAYAAAEAAYAAYAAADAAYAAYAAANAADAADAADAVANAVEAAYAAYAAYAVYAGDAANAAERMEQAKDMLELLASA